LSLVDDLLVAFGERLRVPWRRDETAPGRVWMLWYAKDHERRVRGRIGEFRLAALNAGKGWREFDLAPLFGQWVVAQPWFERAARRPSTLSTVIGQFETTIANRVGAELAACGPDDILTLTGVASLFGLIRAQDLIRRVTDATPVPGRLMLTFPGAHRDGIYRMLDARDGYNYLAVPIPSVDVV
jgi:hypothetical protein